MWRYLRVMVLCLIGMGCYGCSSTALDPFDNQDRFFTVWGFLDVDATVQRIRVVPIRRSPEDIANANGQQTLIDAKVKTINLDTGQELRWQPRLHHVEGTTQVIQVFEAAFTPLEGETYRLEITRSDGVQATAEVIVPDYRTDNEPVIGPLTGEGADLAQTITIQGGPPQAQPHIDYWVHYNGVLRSVKVPYEGTYDADTEVWRFTMRPGRDVPEILRQIGYDPEVGSSVFLDRYLIRLRIPDAEWVLPDDLPLGALGQPGLYDNIEKGYGYFGMVGWYRYTVRPPGPLGGRMPLP